MYFLYIHRDEAEYSFRLWMMIQRHRRCSRRYCSLRRTIRSRIRIYWSRSRRKVSTMIRWWFRMYLVSYLQGMYRGGYSDWKKFYFKIKVKTQGERRAVPLWWVKTWGCHQMLHMHRRTGRRIQEQRGRELCGCDGDTVGEGSWEF